MKRNQVFKWIAEWRQRRKLRRFYLENPYTMLPTDDGGQSYRMECDFCKKEGSVMSKFIHAPGCPAGELEKKKFQKKA
ncbi:MAG: hypothetical protein ABR866_15155 [Candidatus Korobacteraceae bacterium]|jgi:hypothetical protein